MTTRGAASRPSRAELSIWRGTVGASRYFTDAPRFALNELLLRRRTRRYTVRETGRKLIVRHPLVDAYVVSEVLGGTYRVPREAVETLSEAEPLRIVDLGGHIGSATLAMLDQFPDATVTVFEPNPDNARILKAMVSANRLEDKVTVRTQAAGAAHGRVEMDGYSGLAHFSRDDTEMIDELPFLQNALRGVPVTRASVEVVDVLPVLGECDLLKMDIEGAEWPILSDPRFADLPVRALVLEYHRWGAPDPDPAESAARLLREAGFEVGEPFDVRPDAGVLWAWRS
jgi:FkbM family methyltransferase